jgi:hypothetical protein
VVNFTISHSRPGKKPHTEEPKAFGITVEDLFAEPRECLAAALPHLYEDFAVC